MLRLSQILARLSPGKLAAATFASISLGVLAALAGLYGTAIRQKDAALRRHIGDLVVAAAATLDLGRHERLRGAGDFRSADYEAAIAPLLALHRRNPDLQYVWTVRLEGEDRQVLVLETSVDDAIRARQLAAGRSQDLLPFLGPNSETARGWASLPDLKAGRAVVFPGIYEDEHGAYIEARAPLFGREGRFLGYVGIDYALDDFRRQINEVRLVGAGAFAIALLVGAIIARSSYAMRQQSLLYLAAAEEQRDLARKAEAAKGHLLAVASHDLKNPLNAIAGLAGLWLKRRQSGAAAAPAEDVDMLETIHGAARHMSEIVRGILLTEGIGQGGLAFEPKPADVSALAAEVVRFNTPAAAKKTIALHARLEPGLRATVDARGLRECFDNYLSNAIKFSPAGAAVTVMLRPGPGAGEFEFAVQDQGPGLTPADHARAFGKFQRLSARPTGGEFSTGLGLSIVKAVAELHGGSVGCDSEAGRGARFWLRCPLSPPAAISRSPGGHPAAT